MLTLARAALAVPPTSLTVVLCALQTELLGKAYNNLGCCYGELGRFEVASFLIPIFLHICYVMIGSDLGLVLWLLGGGWSCNGSTRTA